MKIVFSNILTLGIQKKMDSFDDAPLVPKGYAPAAYGPKEEVYNRSFNNLVNLIVKTIKDYYNPNSYSSDKDRLHKLLWGNNLNPYASCIKDRLRGTRNERDYTFRTNDFYNTFEHYCKYYGKDEDHSNSYAQLRNDDNFMKSLLNAVEEKFVKEYNLSETDTLKAGIKR